MSELVAQPSPDVTSADIRNMLLPIVQVLPSQSRNQESSSQESSGSGYSSSQFISDFSNSLAEQSSLESYHAREERENELVRSRVTSVASAGTDGWTSREREALDKHLSRHRQEGAVVIPRKPVRAVQPMEDSYDSDAPSESELPENNIVCGYRSTRITALPMPKSLR